MTLFF